ncbi:glycoside hydrolase family 79 protein [Rickenella mellea]|uniref:Glycoside hydrolase family 79 protein n=1 Tax=Rickenella mellea TaxID=50990 RepID=A0A4R5XEJ6_9AGAM|nr:glycoside hydrolase family 79 protein [Rickenella mellea]
MRRCLPVACILLLPSWAFASANTSVFIPATQPISNVVFSNFMGVSIELSSINTYIGEDTSTIPKPMVNYLSTIQSQVQRPLRIRVGGNSMDSSVFVPTQSQMIIFTGVNETDNDRPSTFGPVLFDTLRTLGSNIGGAQHLIGLSLRNASDPNIPVLASYAENGLGDQLDAFLLGNEPDLYTAHDERPLLANYTVGDYMGEFRDVIVELSNSSYGNLLSDVLLGGPNICCNWDLDVLLGLGYIDSFNQSLKYISLQHYPQNNCNDTHDYDIDYYSQHILVVRLASWNLPGIHLAQASGKQVVMDEFNSASCGGIPGISDTFVASLWIIDYSLQMASIGYSAIYLHTRERGVTYNLFDPPAEGNGSDWTTLPAYYAWMSVAESLSSRNGSIVYDLDINNSSTLNSTVAGYSLHDGKTGSVSRLVFFNYAEGGSGPAFFYFSELAGLQAASRKVLVRYLTAPTTAEKWDISWRGQTLMGVGDGIAVSSNRDPDQEISCVDTCTIQVPSPGLAVVWLSADDPDIVKNNACRMYGYTLARNFLIVIVTFFALDSSVFF